MTKFITPSLEKAGWDMQLQILEEASFNDGKIYVRGIITARGNGKRAEYNLYYKPRYYRHISVIAFLPVRVVQLINPFAHLFPIHNP